MKKIITIQTMVLVVVLSVFTLYANSQPIGNLTTTTLLPNGKINHSTVLSDALPDNFLFGNSNYNPSNVLILNGTPVPVLNSGWFTNEGEHRSSNSNYICGTYEGYYYFNFFAIDLSGLGSLGITPPITSAILRIQRYDALPPTGTQQFVLSQVNTPYATINQSYIPPSSPGQSIFVDLGTGTAFGSADIDRTGTGLTDIAINSVGISAINSAIGSTIVIGGRASVTPVPVPNWVIILAFIILASIVVLRFRKRQLA